jgi:CrcB protein
VAERSPERPDDGPEANPAGLPRDARRGAFDGQRPGAASAGGVFGPAAHSRWPRIHWGSVLAVGAGGFAGGLARYAVGLAWPSRGDVFPWPTLAINTSGAFVLALLLILVLDVLPPTTYLRPALGTGFCGAYTTFSSVAVASDQLAAHGRPQLAAGYVGASVVAGLAAAWFGIILGRSIAAGRQQPQRKG